MGVPRMRNPKTVAKEMVGFYHGIQRYKYVCIIYIYVVLPWIYLHWLMFGWIKYLTSCLYFPSKMTWLVEERSHASFGFVWTWLNNLEILNKTTKQSPVVFKIWWECDPTVRYFPIFPHESSMFGRQYQSLVAHPNGFENRQCVLDEYL